MSPLLSPIAPSTGRVGLSLSDQSTTSLRSSFFRLYKRKKRASFKQVLRSKARGFGTHFMDVEQDDTDDLVFFPRAGGNTPQESSSTTTPASSYSPSASSASWSTVSSPSLSDAYRSRPAPGTEWPDAASFEMDEDAFLLDMEVQQLQMTQKRLLQDVMLNHNTGIGKYDMTGIDRLQVQASMVRKRFDAEVAQIRLGVVSSPVAPSKTTVSKIDKRTALRRATTAVTTEPASTGKSGGLGTVVGTVAFVFAIAGILASPSADFVVDIDPLSLAVFRLIHAWQLVSSMASQGVDALVSALQNGGDLVVVPPINTEAWVQGITSRANDILGEQASYVKNANVALPSNLLKFPVAFGQVQEGFQKILQDGQEQWTMIKSTTSPMIMENVATTVRIGLHRGSEALQATMDSTLSLASDKMEESMAVARDSFDASYEQWMQDWNLKASEMHLSASGYVDLWKDQLPAIQEGSMLQDAKDIVARSSQMALDSFENLKEDLSVAGGYSRVLEQIQQVQSDLTSQVSVGFAGFTDRLSDMDRIKEDAMALLDTAKASMDSGSQQSVSSELADAIGPMDVNVDMSLDRLSELVNSESESMAFDHVAFRVLD